MATLSIDIDESVIKRAAIAAKVSNRTVASQIEFWVKIGEIMESNPDLTNDFVKQTLTSKAELRAEKTVKYEFD